MTKVEGVFPTDLPKIMSEEDVIKLIYKDDQPFEVEENELQTSNQRLLTLGGWINDRLRNDWDIVISVCGIEGVGKSNFAIRLCKAIDPTFKIDKNIIFNPEPDQVENTVLRDMPRYTAILLDEAINVSYNRTWASAKQIKLNKTMHIWRNQNKAAVFCMPYFTDFDSYLRKQRIFINFHIIQRGLAICFIRDSSPFVNLDPWSLEENNLVLQRESKGLPFEMLGTRKKISIMKKCKGFYSYFFFDKLSDAQNKLYLELKEKVAKEIAAKNDDKPKNRTERKIYNYLHSMIAEAMSEGVSQVDLSRKHGIPQSTLSEWIGEPEFQAILSQRKMSKNKFAQGLKIRSE